MYYGRRRPDPIFPSITVRILKAVNFNANAEHIRKKMLIGQAPAGDIDKCIKQCRDGSRVNTDRLREWVNVLVA